MATSSASGQEELCCLLCDDDPIVLRTVGQLLKTCGYRVLESKSAKVSRPNTAPLQAPCSSVLPFSQCSGPVPPQQTGSTVR